MPDGTRVPIDISATPHRRPGRHLAIMLFPAARALNERLGHGRPHGRAALTEREREVLTLVALGDTLAEIARRLALSEDVAQTHVTDALLTLGARNRAHGIALAMRAGELAGGLTPGPAARRRATA
jgi:DNA-binding CsgD family transcriptional regulator